MVKQIFRPDRDHAHRYKGQKPVQFHFYQFKKNHAPNSFGGQPQTDRDIIRKYKGHPKGVGNLVAA